MCRRSVVQSRHGCVVCRKVERLGWVGVTGGVSALGGATIASDVGSAKCSVCLSLLSLHVDGRLIAVLLLGANLLLSFSDSVLELHFDTLLSMH